MAVLISTSLHARLKTTINGLTYETGRNRYINRPVSRRPFRLVPETVAFSCALAFTESFNMTSSSTSTFVQGEIYVTAFCSAALDNFHYALAIMMNPLNSVIFHAKELWPDHFVFESKVNSLGKSALCVALKIGEMGHFTLEQVAPLL
ncbi:uncharacterized protein ARMOST_20030 [Armillaria ostoyae]|uniref:Uncharacterized protein n=1 Tax=Armillaria ostoyae TaxID=47428 RepID=A0A284S664_ARMOS|nr:uncharacterized protein ARMOST_20030 [Armillaria ostoyae]